MPDEEFINELKDQLKNVQLNLFVEHSSFDELFKALTVRLNTLITSDFSRLISILYRLDISEKKLQAALRQPASKTAGEIIAGMIVERQAQKIEARKRFKSNNDNISNEERW
ncbi:MAG TPA: hypothetical protein VF623_00220 [Segetibacter sp.]